MPDRKQLEVRGVTIAYGGSPVVRDLSFTLNEGAIGCLLGPSGCGKTSVLRAIAGFEPVTAGEIQLHGRPVSRPGWSLPPEQRRIGMVFQDFALFPHLSVERNVGFRLRSLSREERRDRVSELLELVGLRDAGRKYPHQLSGGMQQRVALARAMAPRPDILLLDEPFSSVDAELREQLAREVRDLLKQDGITAILVTHDQLEAFAMADQIGVLGGERLRQWGSGFEIYHRPEDRFVAGFIGQGVMLKGQVLDDVRVATALGPLSGRHPHGLGPGRRVEVLLRPDDLIHDDASALRAEVLERAFRGAEFLYTLRLSGGETALCLVQSHHSHGPGERIGIRAEIEHLVVFPNDAPGNGAEGTALSVVS